MFDYDLRKQKYITTLKMGYLLQSLDNQLIF